MKNKSNNKYKYVYHLPHCLIYIRRKTIGTHISISKYCPILLTINNDNIDILNAYPQTPNTKYLFCILVKCILGNKYIEYNIFKSVENININQVMGYYDYDKRHNYYDDYD